MSTVDSTAGLERLTREEAVALMATQEVGRLVVVDGVGAAEQEVLEGMRAADVFPEAIRGGVLFAAILVGTIVLRFGIRYIVFGNAFGTTGSRSTGPVSPSLAFLSEVSADLLFLSLGLWASRAFFLIQRQRASGAPPGQVGG